MKTTESLVETTLKTTESLFETTVKTTESLAETTLKTTESLAETTLRTTESLVKTTQLFETTRQTTESVAETTQQTIELFETTRQTTESEAETTQQTTQLFETTRQTTESEAETTQQNAELFETTRQTTESVAETTQQTTESLAGIITTQRTTVGDYTTVKEATTEPTIFPEETTASFTTEMEGNDFETTRKGFTTVKETSVWEDATTTSLDIRTGMFTDSVLTCFCFRKHASKLCKIPYRKVLVCDLTTSLISHFLFIYALLLSLLHDSCQISLFARNLSACFLWKFVTILQGDTKLTAYISANIYFMLYTNLHGCFLTVSTNDATWYMHGTTIK